MVFSVSFMALPFTERKSEVCFGAIWKFVLRKTEQIAQKTPGISEGCGTFGKLLVSPGNSRNAVHWTVKNASGELIANFGSISRLEVARKVVPVRDDAFRLHVSPSYRELFDRALRQIVERRDWQIVRVKLAPQAPCQSVGMGPLAIYGARKLRWRLAGRNIGLP
jgi:hypothetical protein